MSQDITEETLEEGRVALFQLERQLKDRGIVGTDARSETSSKQHSAASERRLLDQLPRVTRLNNRLESLGLTVEELDDRGLLDGGGSVPSYYTSLKQKNRRVLELQPRSHRLLERGKEVLSKLLNAVFHMIRILNKRGLNIEEYFRSMDIHKTGFISKKQMVFILKQLGLPFTIKDLQDITQHYCQPASEKVDYVAFLQDGRIAKRNGRDLVSVSSGERLEDNSPKDITSYTVILQVVKRMLLESIKTLNKNFDDVYRMFARWDTQGSGTVTATQFLRVLARLHIELSDQDQDFLVELLDTNAMGRIDFESLLSYCFSEEITSPHGNFVGAAIGFDDNAGETLSAVSIDGNSLELKSTTSGNLLKRPHTASISRPYSDHVNNPTRQEITYAPTAVRSVAVPVATVANNVRTNDWPVGFEEKKKNDRNRPSTAVGRVSSQQGYIPKKHNTDDSDGVIDLPDDVINGEETYLNNRDHHHQVKYNPLFQKDNTTDENNENNMEYNQSKIFISFLSRLNFLVLLSSSFSFR
jgi:Ca2+-binding EF-hand superfamily protein